MQLKTTLASLTLCCSLLLTGCDPCAEACSPKAPPGACLGCQVGQLLCSQEEAKVCSARGCECSSGQCHSCAQVPPKSP